MTSPLAAKAAVNLDAPIIVHSHLRWDFVWQRPQQLLSRFALRNEVLFVEDGIEGLVDVVEPHDQLVLRPIGSAPNPREH